VKKTSDVKGPIKAFYYPHKTIREELKKLELMASELPERLEELEKRFVLLRGLMEAHTRGEKRVFYPAINNLRKGMGDFLDWDAQLENDYIERIHKTIQNLKKKWNQDAANKLMREIAALHMLQTAHTKKEDELALPLIDREIEPPEQGKIVGGMSQQIPRDILEDLFKLMIKSLNQDERKNYLQIIKRGVPPEEFKSMAKWAKDAITEEDWSDLKSSIELE
jgi:iron-sulfur cluster repair protein YtfE (RIC family)